MDDRPPAAGPTLRELGFPAGRLPTGPGNRLSDVPGVRVGHASIVRGHGRLCRGEGPVRTGVTAVWPHPGDPFQEKVKAGVHVINGFGKAVGLSQVVELGSLETPILLTNTLNVGLVADAVVQAMILANPEIGVTTGTVNPVVGECSDAWLNDIQGRHVRAEQVAVALREAGPAGPAGGAVGAGTGMVAFGYKAGIGQASREWDAGGLVVRLGALVLANFGARGDLVILGVPVGRLTPPGGEVPPPAAVTGGSAIIVLATDAPLDSRQLARLARRAVVGLARTGSHVAHGSGDFVIAFSTANREPHRAAPPVVAEHRLLDHSPAFDQLLRGVGEATEEAVYNALFLAEPMTGRDGHHAPALSAEQVGSLLAASRRALG
ncbi:MAG TPA: P1 family peptidase [Bacillota bacterium]|nr:P1 family peptidase [Bacillota bacterium]